MSLSLRERFDFRRFFIGEKPSNRPVTLTHRRIFILPSKRGFVAAILLVLMLLASTVYNNNLGFLLTFLLASVFFISILHSFRVLAGLRLRVGKVEPVFAGQAALFNIHLQNDSHLPRININLSGKGAEPVTLDIAAQSAGHAQLSVMTENRGWQILGTVTLFCYYPLGLFRAWSPINLDHRVLVYPKPANVSSRFPDAQSHTGETGEQRRGGDDFYGFHHYQPGDSLRQIHWKAVAKGQGVHTKLYSGENTSEIWLDWAQTPGAGTEARLSQLCRWVLDAEAAGLAYGLRLPALTLAPDSGPGHSGECLRALALFERRG